jgi:hypothetical protein
MDLLNNSGKSGEYHIGFNYRWSLPTQPATPLLGRIQPEGISSFAGSLQFDYVGKSRYERCTSEERQFSTS